MNKLEPSQSFHKDHWWRLHPSHEVTTYKLVLFLALLAFIQFLSWLIPSAPNHQGISYYLSLHTLMETLSITVAMMVVAVGWNYRQSRNTQNLALLACLFFAVGVLDSLHMVSYAGMPEFLSQNDTDKHLNFWLSARFLAALALLLVSICPWETSVSKKFQYVLFSLTCTTTALFTVLVVYRQDLFPNWFIPGQGLTPLKKFLEYVFILMNIGTAVVLWIKMRQPQSFKASLLFAAVCTMAMSEFFFTLYATLTGAYNVLGHIYKVISYYFIYRAVVVEAIEQPYLKLEVAQQNLELAVRASNTGLWDWNIQNGHAIYSPVWKAQLGYTDAELENNFNTWESLLHPDDKSQALQRVQDFLASDQMQIYESEFRLRHKDGSYHWILSRGEKECDHKGRLQRLVGSHTDLTEFKRAEDRFRSALQASPNAMIMTDESGTIVLTNTEADTLFGYTNTSLLGKSIAELIPTRLRAQHALHFQSYLKMASERRVGEGKELFALHRDGYEFRVEIGLTPIFKEEGRYILASIVDITSRIQSERKIRQLIYFDSLTGLPNRHLLQETVQNAILQAQQDKAQLGLLFLDIDHFKNVNDTLGHRTGDELLIEISRRLRDNLLKENVISRMGGDEFVVIINQCDDQELSRIAERLLNKVSKPYHLEKHNLTVTASIGIASFPRDGEDFETLYQHADIAMYNAKHDGRNDYRFFNHDMQLRTARVLALENAMHQALERNEFYLQYQPQLSIKDHRVIGVEALLRWKHPELGMISPAEFIPLAENSGQIIAIGTWVIRTAVNQLKRWLDSGLPPMVMAVNLSAIQFKHPDLPGLVSSILEQAQLAPEYLELELTEGVAMGDPVHAIGIMDDLHSRGVRMSIDDFGTGYSSLSYLKKFNIYKLKIDQSFVRDIATDADDSAIVSAIIQLAHSLGFITIAEGVETEAQREFLLKQGCDELQGYLFSRPLMAQDTEQFIKLNQQQTDLG
ncbi:EAL domain-containing protein [Undibacterium amnicola]|uniref:EAL domain-containing protein n=1 Tax=Undibacterium amnicola TaxID=1834038 RepID=A0ABR6XMZ2_9BURK|nr:EAL domain-containing protein [Undibacterium amnicola]MBC3830880.1 EAL domain-containing protein [Undibacterium amnicola]